MLTVYKASAGSGKTFTLTYEYIKLLLGKKDEDSYHLCKEGRERHRSILAVTFTNKATAEMKQRIVKELALLAGIKTDDDDESPYIKSLIKDFGCSQAELQERARIALCELLFDYGFFNISTIDSFFQNILRIFAREAELTGNYDVELEDNLAIMSGVSDLFSTLNAPLSSIDSEVAKRRAMLIYWLKKYMKALFESEKGFNLFNRSSNIYGSIVKFVKDMYKDEFKINSEAILEYVQDEEKILKFEELIIAERRRLYNLMTSSARRLLEILPDCTETHLSKTTRGTIKSVANGIMKEFPAGITTILENIDEPSNRYTKKYISQVPPGFDELYVDAIYAIHENVQKFKLYQNMCDNIYMLGLLSGVLREIDRYRQENNLILLSDTNDILKRIISEDELPFIYERVGTALKHFLIDEFQDTSRLQWENLRPLISESLSQNQDNLIIGDEKQCIYRFRDSDPTLLQTQVGAQYEGQITERGNDISSNTNWRSSADVVRFNNTLFTAIAGELGLEHLYGNVAQQVSPKHREHRGYVLFNRVNVSRTGSEYNEIAFDLMAKEIKRQLESGYKQSDIAILVRDGIHGRSAIAYLLEKQNSDPQYPRLKLLSDGALQIGNSNAVRLIVSVLRFLESPERGAAGKYKTSDSEVSRFLSIFEQGVSQGLELNEALQIALKKRKETEPLAQIVQSMECVSLSSIVDIIISNYVPQELIENDNIYISAFQDVIIDFASRGAGDLRSFLKWWDDGGYKMGLSFPDSIDAIKVITIHKSKGLEFRCVHIPVAAWEMIKNTDVKWFHSANAFPEIADRSVVPPFIPLSGADYLSSTAFKEQYERNRDAELVDQLNATYVAFTRAVDELIVSYRKPSSSKEDDKVGHVGNLIENAIIVASEAFCKTHEAKFRDKLKPEDREIFVSLADKFEDGILKIGSPTTYVDDEKKKKVEIIKVPNYYSVSHDEVWNNSQIEDSLDITKPRDRGIILHAIMNNVRRGADVPVAVARYAYRNQLPKAEADEICEFLQKAVSGDRVSKWFDGYKQVITERKIYFRYTDEKNNEMILNKRPDRVVWTADGGIDIIDYKFGRAKEDYLCQVNSYMKHFHEMGHDLVRGYVWYLDSGQIDEVKYDPDMPEYFPKSYEDTKNSDSD